MAAPHPLLAAPFSCDLDAALALPLLDAAVDVADWVPALARLNEQVFSDRSSTLLLSALKFTRALLEGASAKPREAYPSLRSIVALARHSDPAVAEEACQLLADLASRENLRSLSPSMSDFLDSATKAELVRSMAECMVADKYSSLGLCARRVLLLFHLETPDESDTALIVELSRLGLGARRDAAATEAVRLMEALLQLLQHAAAFDVILNYSATRRGLISVATKQALTELEPEPKDAGLAFVRAATDLEKHTLAVLSLACECASSESTAVAFAESGVLKAAATLLTRNSSLSPKQLFRVCSLVEAVCSHQGAFRSAVRHTREGHVLVELVAHTLAEVDARPLSREQRSVLGSALRCIRELVHNSPSNGRRESLIAGAVLRPPSPLGAALSLGVDNAKHIGGPNFSEVCTLVTDIVQSDPSSLEAVARSELGRAFLLRLLGNLAASLPLEVEALAALPELFGILAQCQTGKTTMLNSRFVHRLLCVIEALGPHRLPARTIDLMGSHVEDFIRNTSWMRKQCMQDLADFFSEPNHSLYSRVSALDFSCHVLVARELSHIFCEVGGLQALLQLLNAPSSLVQAEAARKVMAVLSAHACKDVWLVLQQVCMEPSTPPTKLLIAVDVLADMVPNSYSPGAHHSSRWEQAVNVDLLFDVFGHLLPAYLSNRSIAKRYKDWVVAVATWFNLKALNEGSSSRETSAKEHLAALVMNAMDNGDVVLAVAVVASNEAVLKALAEKGRLVSMLSAASGPSLVALLNVVSSSELNVAVSIKALEVVAALAQDAQPLDPLAVVQAASRLLKFSPQKKSPPSDSKSSSPSSPSLGGLPSTPASAAASKSNFSPDPGVANALAAMGYVPFHVKMAQFATQSNNMLVLSNWLMENNATLNEEDEEVQLAMWMSLQPPAEDEGRLEKDIASFKEAAERAIDRVEAMALAMLDSLDPSSPAYAKETAKVCVDFLMEHRQRTGQWVVERLCRRCASLRFAFAALAEKSWTVTPEIVAAVYAQLDDAAPLVQVAHVAACLDAMGPIPEESRAEVAERVWVHVVSHDFDPDVFDLLCGVYGKTAGGRSAAGAADRARSLLGTWKLAPFVCKAWPSVDDTSALVLHMVHDEFVKISSRDDAVTLKGLVMAMMTKPLFSQTASKNRALLTSALQGAKLDEKGSKVVEVPDATLASDRALNGLITAASAELSPSALCELSWRVTKCIPGFAVELHALGLVGTLLRGTFDLTVMPELFKILAWADPQATANALVARLTEEPSEPACELLLKVCEGRLLKPLHDAELESKLLDLLHRNQGGDAALRLLERIMQPEVRTAIATGLAEVPVGDGEHGGERDDSLARLLSEHHQRFLPFFHHHHHHRGRHSPAERSMEDEAVLHATVEALHRAIPRTAPLPPPNTTPPPPSSSSPAGAAPAAAGAAPVTSSTLEASPAVAIADASESETSPPPPVDDTSITTVVMQDAPSPS